MSTSDDETRSLDSVVMTKVTSPNGSITFDSQSTVVSQVKIVRKANLKMDDGSEDDEDDKKLLETPTFRRIWKKKPLTMDEVLISMGLNSKQQSPSAAASAGSKDMSLSPKDLTTGRHDGPRQHKWMVNFLAAVEKYNDGTLSSLSAADPLRNFLESQSDYIQDLWKKQADMGTEKGKQEWLKTTIAKRNLGINLDYVDTFSELMCVFKNSKPMQLSKKRPTIHSTNTGSASKSHRVSNKSNSRFPKSKNPANQALHDFMSDEADRKMNDFAGKDYPSFIVQQAKYWLIGAKCLAKLDVHITSSAMAFQYFPPGVIGKKKDSLCRKRIDEFFSIRQYG